jgi:transcription elongation factor GreA
MESPITLKGKKKIEQELENLIRKDREEIKQKISEARELGDLRENAEYQTAKEKQSLIEGRILQLQGVLASSQVIDVTKITSSNIVFGATITLYDLDKDSKVTYQIVSDHEADIRQSKISYKSPLGRALIGKSQGDTIIVKAPKGDVEYEIESFKYI